MLIQDFLNLYMQEPDELYRDVNVSFCCNAIYMGCKGAALSLYLPFHGHAKVKVCKSLKWYVKYESETLGNLPGSLNDIYISVNPKFCAVQYLH